MYGSVCLDSDTDSRTATVLDLEDTSSDCVDVMTGSYDFDTITTMFAVPSKGAVKGLLNTSEVSLSLDGRSSSDVGSLDLPKFSVVGSVLWWIADTVPGNAVLNSYSSEWDTDVWWWWKT